MKYSRAVLAAAAVTLVLPLASVASAGRPAAGGGTTVATTFDLPVNISGWVTEDSWCDNKGPHITISTGSQYGGFATELTFMNNLNDRSVLERVGSSALEVVGDGTATSASIWKQPSRGGAGGNPFIYVDPDGAGSAAPVYIGRCVQDGKIGQLNHGRWSVDTSTLASSTLTAQALECSNRTSSLTISTDTSADAPSGSLIFSNSNLGLNPQHIHESDISVSWSFNNGSPLRVRKGGGATGAGGNPLVTSEYGALSEGAVVVNGVLTGTGTFTGFGTPGVTTYRQLGRCNKI